MANTLRFKRGLASGIPTAVAGEPLFTTDTFDLYIGNGTTNTRFQKYIASGTTSEYLRGDGSLATFPSLTGFVPYTGATANVDLGTHTIIAQNATISSSGSGNTATITHSSGSGIGLNITKGGNGEGLYINKTSGSGNAATIIGTLNATTLVKSGGTSTQYLMADGSTSTLTNPITGSGSAGQVAYFTGATTQAGSNNLFWDNTNARLGIGTATPQTDLHISKAGSRTLRITNSTNSTDVELGISTALGYVGTNTANSFAIYTNNTERARITPSTGNLVVGTFTSDSGQRLQVIGDTLLRGSGNTSGSTALRVQNSDTLQLFQILNNGNVGIGDASLAGYTLNVGKNITGSIISAGIWQNGSVLADVTTNAIGIYNLLRIQASTAISSYQHFRAEQAAFGAGATLGTQIGFIVENSLTGATNNFGFYGNIAAATNRWNLYMNGTANNYMAGSLGIGTTTLSAATLTVSRNISADGSYGIFQNGQIQTAVTGNGGGFINSLVTIANTTLTNYYHYRALEGTIGATTAITNNFGYHINDMATGTNRFGYYGNVASGTNKWNIYMNGTALNYMNGALLLGSTTSSGEQLQVTGTMKVTGASTFTATGASISMTTAGDSGIWSQVSNSGGFLYVGRDNSTGSSFGVANAHVIYGTAARPMVFFTNSLQRMTLDASGNLGLGVTPSAWGASYKVLQLPAGFVGADGTLVMQMGQNHRWTGAANVYINNGFASDYYQYNGQHVFSTAASGTAGGTITWTQAMLLTAAGRLILGAGADSGERLQVTGTAKITGATTFGSSVTAGTYLMAKGALPSLVSSSIFIDYVSNIGRIASVSNLTNTYVPIYLSQYSSDGSLGRDALVIASTGAATFSSSVTAASGIITGNLTVDTNTLFVDATNDFVGIGTTTNAGYRFRVNGTSYFDNNIRFPNLRGVLFQQTGGTLLGSISMDSGNAVSIDNNGFIGLSVGSNFNLLGGNTGIGTSTFGTSATRTFAVLNGTAPSTSPADTFQMYSNDITSGNAAPHFRTENGAVIKLYQQDNGVAAANFISGIGSPVTTLDIFDGYTIGQVVKALRNAGILS
jgi:hypothetical protein